MKIQIKNRWSGSVIFETDSETIGSAVEAAISARANLREADLRGANLREADLSGANLREADLSGANLREADLYGADLYGADLREADLRCADLRGADLRCADLRGAKIAPKELSAILNRRTILPDGELIGWKKLQGGIICKLKIPADANRVGGLTGRKCRCEFAFVLEGEGKAQHDGMEYRVGEKVVPDKYDPDPTVECSNGIHFFITKQEAEDYY